MLVRLLHPFVAFLPHSEGGDNPVAMLPSWSSHEDHTKSHQHHHERSRRRRPPRTNDLSGEPVYKNSGHDEAVVRQGWLRKHKGT
jgi:hypothetical protein